MLSRTNVLAQGLTDNDIRAAVARGEITALCRGVYTRTETLATANPSERHRLVVRASLLDAPTGMAASHQSAAAMHHLGTFGNDFGAVHVSTGSLTGGYRSSRRHVHAAGLERVDISLVDGIPVTSAARTVADLARTWSFEKAVCAGDSALRRRITTRKQISDALARTRSSHKKTAAEGVVNFLDGRSESVGESRSRVYFRHWGVPDPEPQVTLLDEHGFVLARPDWLWEEAALIGEFDGLSKYSKFARPGEKPTDTLAREKVREDQLRAHGWMVFRWIWRDLDSRAVADRILRELSVKRPRPRTIRRF